MSRQESQKGILDRDRSVKDISRAEKHYLNVAYDDESCDVSDDEGQFMVQVDLGKPRNKSPAMVSFQDNNCTSIVSTRDNVLPK